MIRFDYLRSEREKMRMDFLLGQPFPHLVIDGICEQDRLEKLYAELPEIDTKSRDYVFANNKFEKSKFWLLSPVFKALYEDLISVEFEEFLCFITNEEVFIDRKFHGGGIHQGKQDSFLDMHLDFNYHPLQKLWYRNLNILLYLNPAWQEEYGGQLELEDLRTGKKKSLGVPFNRMIIQQTRNFTLHGYHVTRFPPGQYRTSIACYAYSRHLRYIEKRRTTDWHVDADQPVKRLLAWVYDPAVKIKNALFGSGTAKH